MEFEMEDVIKNIASKQDVMLEQVTNLRVDVAKIEEHLKKLNGTVARHELAITANENRSIATDKKLAYYIGGLAALWALVQVAIKFI